MKKLDFVGPFFAKIAWVTIPIGEQLNQPWPGQDNPYKIQRIEPVIMGVVQMALMIAAIITFACIVISGVQWVSSGGDKQNVMAARERLTNCIIGLAIVATALAVIKIAEYFIGVQVI